MRRLFLFSVLVAFIPFASVQAQQTTRPRLDLTIPPGILASYKGTIFLLINGEQVPFASMAAFTGLGYQLKNVKAVDLSQKGFTQTKGIFSSNVGHTWGSWLIYKGTVYYSHRDGLIPVPDWTTFLENGGFSEAILPANSYDIAILRQAPNLPVLQKWDTRVWLFDPAQVALRDELRVERLQKLQTVLTAYKSAKGSYPASLSVMVPEFMPSLPPPVVPPDGSCNTSKNQFRYQVTETGYEVRFCLGAAQGSYTAGENVATPAQ